MSRPRSETFWSFPHTLLYSEPPRLGTLGLVTEAREAEGRRRRVFATRPRVRPLWAPGRIDRRVRRRSFAIPGSFNSSSQAWRPMKRNVDSPSANSRSTRRSSPPTVRPIGTNGARMGLSGASVRSSTGAAKPYGWVCGTRRRRSISGPTSSRKPARPPSRSPATINAWWPLAFRRGRRFPDRTERPRDRRQPRPRSRVRAPTRSARQAPRRYEMGRGGRG
jgi:hypothetical protein